MPSSIFFPHTPSHIHRDSVLEENEQKDAVLVNDIRPETAAMLTLNVSVISNVPFSFSFSPNPFFSVSTADGKDNKE